MSVDITMNHLKALKLIFAYLLAILLLGSTALPVHSQQVVEFKNYRTEITFMANIRFAVELCGLPPKAKAILHVHVSHDNWEVLPAFIDEADSGSCATGRYVYRMRGYPPFIPVAYYWQVYLPGAGFLDGEHQSILYEDTRYQWQKLESGNITLFWHDRPVEFGRQILEIAERADRAQSAFFDLELKSPYRVVIYNTAEEFFSWNVDLNENVAGEALPFYDLTVQIVEDDSQDWLNEVIPHEISHLYFNQAVYHPIAVSYPPNWLNEGVAVYNELSTHRFEDFLLRQAVFEERLIPLNQLAGSFGDDSDTVSLAYAEGYSAVSYLIETYGRDDLMKLMNAYRSADSTEEAFTFAFGKTPPEFETEWLDWLKEKYSSEGLSGISPFPMDAASLQAGLLVILSICSLVISPIICIITFFGGAGLLLLIRRSVYK